MIEYITRAELLEIRNTLREDVAEADSLQKSYKAALTRRALDSTFVSHSSSDDDVVPTVVRILENHGANVYLDKRDPALLESKPRDTAEVLRTEIKQSKKFVLFASENTKNSRWVPWELGIADGTKGRRNVALFAAPDKTYEKEWVEQEYFAIYDRIVYGHLGEDPDPQWFVWDQINNTGTRLRRWLTT